tara:strand:+ start:1496 stop:1798 length:303 start_codon:yes stop_codon:yes gene_type:complete
MINTLKSEVNAYLKHNNTTLGYIASECDISSAFLTNVLKGNQKMPESLFLKLLDVLKLKERDRGNLVYYYIIDSHPRLFSEFLTYTCYTLETLFKKPCPD